MKALTKTNFNFKNQKSLYNGKVRDVYNINDELMVMVVTDRISAFDVILPKGIPFKGQVLNQIASKFLDLTADKCRPLLFFHQYQEPANEENSYSRRQEQNKFPGFRVFLPTP